MVGGRNGLEPNPASRRQFSVPAAQTAGAKFEGPGRPVWPSKCSRFLHNGPERATAPASPGRGKFAAARARQIPGQQTIWANGLGQFFNPICLAIFFGWGGQYLHILPRWCPALAAGAGAWTCPPQVRGRRRPNEGGCTFESRGASPAPADPRPVVRAAPSAEGLRTARVASLRRRGPPAPFRFAVLFLALVLSARRCAGSGSCRTAHAAESRHTGPAAHCLRCGSRASSSSHASILSLPASRVAAGLAAADFLPLRLLAAPDSAQPNRQCRFRRTGKGRPEAECRDRSGDPVRPCIHKTK